MCRTCHQLAVATDARADMGRACGNLGNLHFLLGETERAIEYHTMVRRVRVCARTILLAIASVHGT
jgi:hypothetical protein